jgi:hypothetical protein
MEEQEASRIVSMFREKDEQLIREQHAIQHDEEQLIQTSIDTGREFEQLLKNAHPAIPLACSCRPRATAARFS